MMSKLKTQIKIFEKSGRRPERELRDRKRLNILRNLPNFHSPKNKQWFAGQP